MTVIVPDHRRRAALAALALEADRAQAQRANIAFDDTLRQLTDVRHAINLGLIDSAVAFAAAVAWESEWAPGTGAFTRECAAFWLRLALELEATP